MLNELFTIIRSRKTEMPHGSYTAELLKKGQSEILMKIEEESSEVILAAKSQGDRRLIEEIADLIYHTFVLLAARDLSLEAVEDELRRRHRSKGDEVEG